MNKSFLKKTFLIKRRFFPIYKKKKKIDEPKYIDKILIAVVSPKELLVTLKRLGNNCFPSQG